MQLFMIQDCKTKLFSTGGKYAKWVPQKKGKIWKSLQYAQQAISWYNRNELSEHQRKIFRLESDLRTVEKYNKRSSKPKILRLPDSILESIYKRYTEIIESAKTKNISLSTPDPEITQPFYLKAKIIPLKTK
jgi:hypothetical protein